MAIQPFFALSTDKYFVRRIHRSGVTQTYAYAPEPERCKIIGVPDASIDIRFDCSGEDVQAFVLGPVSRHAIVQSRPGHFYCGIRFDPGILPPFIEGRFSDFLEKSIPLGDCIADRKLKQQLVQARHSDQRTDLLVRSMMHFSLDEKENQRKAMLREMTALIIRSKGCVRIEDLARQFNYSPRYVDKVFHQALGISPKQFCQAIRFQRTLFELTHGQENVKMVDLAQACGYYDQAQMTRYFKAATTLTPKKYRNQIVKSQYEKKFVNY
ncbi:MAG: helix-turn-helix domain-containing protein [Pseudoramibacter sp.]